MTDANFNPDRRKSIISDLMADKAEFNPMAKAVAAAAPPPPKPIVPTAPYPVENDNDAVPEPVTTKPKVIAGVHKATVAVPSRPAEHKVFRMPVTLFANAAGNQDHPYIKGFSDLLLDGFVPYAAIGGDMGHSFVFMYRRAT